MEPPTQEFLASQGADSHFQKSDEIDYTRKDLDIREAHLKFFFPANARVNTVSFFAYGGNFQDSAGV